MAGGNRFGEVSHSPIIESLAVAESGTTGEIRVHLSKSWLEKDPFARARKIFTRFGMTRTSQHNAVLLYVNLRKKRFALVGDRGFQQAVGQPFWEKLARELTINLRSTHPERAIALAVTDLGHEMKRHFPAETGKRI